MRVLEMSKPAVTVDRDHAARRPNSLLRWLNQEISEREAYLGRPTRASRARVSGLLREITETSAMLAASDKEDPNLDFFDNPPKAIVARVRRVQAMLDDYPMWPTVEISYKGWDAVLHFSHANGPGRPTGEQLAVWDITNLAENGLLEMVRICQCQRWFFARREDQKACSPGCRHKNYEQTEEFKTKRRAYMREYYALKKSGKVK
jgi:hypothetical protein